MLAFILSTLPWVNNFLANLHTFGYIGALIGGIFYVYSFTVGIGIMIIVILSKSLPILPLVFISSFGSMLGDTLLFKITKDNLKDELLAIYKIIDKTQIIRKFLYHQKIKWILPILGITIIASPLSNELGIMLLGVSDIKKRYFMPASFLLNGAGLYLLIIAIT